MEWQLSRQGSVTEIRLHPDGATWMPGRCPAGTMMDAFTGTLAHAKHHCWLFTYIMGCDHTMALQGGSILAQERRDIGLGVKITHKTNGWTGSKSTSMNGFGSYSASRWSNYKEGSKGSNLHFRRVTLVTIQMKDWDKNYRDQAVIAYVLTFLSTFTVFRNFTFLESHTININ